MSYQSHSRAEHLRQNWSTSGQTPLMTPPILCRSRNQTQLTRLITLTTEEQQVLTVSIHKLPSTVLDILLPVTVGEHGRCHCRGPSTSRQNAPCCPQDVLASSAHCFSPSPQPTVSAHPTTDWIKTFTNSLKYNSINTEECKRKLILGSK